MKFSISNIAWKPSERLQVYNLLKKYNFDAIEIAPLLFLPKLKYKDFVIKKKLKELKKFNLQISSMQSLLYNNNSSCKLFGSRVEINNLIKELKKKINLAHKLKISNLVFGSPKNRVIPNNYSYDVNQEAKKVFVKLSNYASNKNITLSIEANPADYGTNFINDIFEAIRFVRLVDKKNIKLNLDLGEIIYNKNKKYISSIIKNNVDIINHVHFSEPFLKNLTNIQFFKKTFQILKKNNYKKYISLEIRQSNVGNLKKLEEAINFMSKLKSSKQN